MKALLAGCSGTMHKRSEEMTEFKSHQLPKQHLRQKLMVSKNIFVIREFPSSKKKLLIFATIERLEKCCWDSHRV